MFTRPDLVYTVCFFGFPQFRYLAWNKSYRERQCCQPWNHCLCSFYFRISKWNWWNPKIHTVLYWSIARAKKRNGKRRRRSKWQKKRKMPRKTVQSVNSFLLLFASCFSLGKKEKKRNWTTILLLVYIAIFFLASTYT